MSDKISYSFSMKLNLGNYESAGINLSYETAVKEGETPSKAYARAVTFVETKVEEKVNEFRPTGNGED